MRVLYIVELHYPHVGGVEALYKNLSERLAKQGHDVTVLTTRLPNTKKKEHLNGVKIIRVSTPPFARRHWFSLLAMQKAIELAKHHDIIHTTTYNAAIPARYASWSTSTPSLITVHEVFGRKWSTLTRLNPIVAWAYRIFEERIVNLQFDWIATPSEYSRKGSIQLGADPNKVSVVHAGIDYDIYNPKKVDKKLKKKLGLEKNFTLISFGRPGLSKGIEYLVQAMPKIVKQIPNAKLLLLLADSPKDRYDYIKQLIKELNLKECILLKKPVPRKDLPSYIAAADCAVIPSLSEGFGLSVAESCAMGIPVVTTNVGSIPEVVSGKYVLVEPKSARAIAQGVERIFKKEYQTSKKKTFTWDANAKKYLALYKQLVKKK